MSIAINGLTFGCGVEFWLSGVGGGGIEELRAGCAKENCEV
jgi:hypothetical protein